MRRLLSLVTVVLVSAALSLVESSVTNIAPASAATDPSGPLTRGGYWAIGANARVSGYGNTPYGNNGPIAHLNGRIVGGAPTAKGSGYWLVGSDGGVFSYGDARFYGSTGSIKLNQPVVGMTGTADGGGYWFVASDGGVFAYGNARFFGSMGGKALNKPIVGMAATPSGNGYWLVASDGGIFAYGDAAFKGSTGSTKLNQPVVGMAALPSGGGYWLVASDGGIFTFGSARFFGSAGSLKLVKPVVGMAPSPSGGGYWLVASDGGIFTYGDGQFFGSATGVDNGGAVVGLAAVPRQRTSETSIFYYPWYASAGHDGGWRHWDQGGNTPPDYLATDYWPKAGAYSSADTAVTTDQMNQIKQTGITTIVISWWGNGSWEDSTLASLLPEAAAAGLRVAVHIEPYSGRTAATVAGDYSYLRGRGVNEFYVYQANLLSVTGLASANDALGSGVRAFAESGSFADTKSGAFANWASRAHFTGIYSYAGFGYSANDFATMCDTAHSNHLLCSPSVAPGFSAKRSTTIKTVSDRRNGATYDDEWNAAIAAGADVVSITSYNEWHEGTQIEPAVPHVRNDGSVDLNYVGAYGEPGDANYAYMTRTGGWTDTFKRKYPAAY